MEVRSILAGFVAFGFSVLASAVLVLCEVAGPARSAPGMGRVEGSFRYLTVG